MFAFNLVRTLVAASAVGVASAFDQCCAGGQCGMDNFENNTTCPSPSAADSMDDSCDEAWGCTPAPGNMCGVEEMCGLGDNNMMCGVEDMMCAPGNNSTANNFEEMQAEFDAAGQCGFMCQASNALNSTFGFNQTNDEVDSYDSL